MEMQVTSLSRITLRCLLALSKKATSFGKKKFALRELCQLFRNMSHLSICPLTMPVSYSLCQLLFI